MNRLVTRYLFDLEARGLSSSLRQSSEYALGLLIRYLRETHAVAGWRGVGCEHVEGFLGHLRRERRTRRGRPLKPATVAHWFSAVRSFFAWQLRRGHLPSDPAADVDVPRAEPPLPRVPGEGEMTRLVEAPDTSTAVGVRDRALLELLYATGIRRGEAHRLDLRDADLKGRRLLVRRGKGRRDRVVPLTDAAAWWIAEYLRAVRPELALGTGGESTKSTPPTDALWLSRMGRRLSYEMLGRRVKAHAAAAGVEAGVHTLRHCCATHLLRGGASIRHVQQLLGHASLDTTAIYTHLTVDDLRRAVARLPQSSLAGKRGASGME